MWLLNHINPNKGLKRKKYFLFILLKYFVNFCLRVLNRLLLCFLPPLAFAANAELLHDEEIGEFAPAERQTAFCFCSLDWPIFWSEPLCDPPPPDDDAAFPPPLAFAANAELLHDEEIGEFAPAERQTAFCFCSLDWPIFWSEPLCDPPPPDDDAAFPPPLAFAANAELLHESETLEFAPAERQTAFCFCSLDWPMLCFCLCFFAKTMLSSE